MFDEIHENPIVSESTKNNEDSNIILDEEKGRKLEETKSEELNAPIDEIDDNQEIIAEVIEDTDTSNFETEDNEQIEDNLFQGLSHLEKLKAEARLEIQKEQEETLSSADSVEENETELGRVNKKSKKEKKTVHKESNKIDEDVKEKISELTKMNVPQLRKLARSIVNFPIKGREISKANRVKLLSYFNQLEE